VGQLVFLADMGSNVALLRAGMYGLSALGTEMMLVGTYHLPRMGERVLMGVLDLPALPRMVTRGRRHRPAMCTGRGRLCRLCDLHVRLHSQCPARARARDRGVD
jgi:hypothetical protein